MSAAVPGASALSRRGLLATGGAFVLFYDPLSQGALAQTWLPGSLANNRRLDAWLRVNADGTVTLMTGKVELGQGILTALSQICAEELDVELARVRVVSGDTAVTPSEGTTAGSQSMQFSGTAVKFAAAEMRAILLAMAAQQLGADAAALNVADGTVSAPGGRSTTYWALLGGRTVEREATASAQPKDPARYRIVGTATPRVDLPDKVTGRPAYIQDLRLDGMVHARIVRPPRYGARLAAVDDGAFAAMPGVVKVVRNGSFLAVIATREEQAIAAAAALRGRARWEGYGHNGADDAAGDAAVLATALPGRPVRVQWMREDEHAWEPYGSAMVLKARAGLAADGSILDWDYELWSCAHSTRPDGHPGNLLAAQTIAAAHRQPVPRNGGGPNYAADRNAIPLYAFPGQRVTTHFITAMPVRVSALRGLGAYANVFAIESFVDELAHAAGADPVAYRLRHMTDARARAVIELAAERFGWAGYRRSEGRGRGIAFARYKNLGAYTAVAVEVLVDRASGAVRVLRAVAGNDSGQIVNRDGIANQIEGGVIQSASWTLKERVRFDREKILSRDWADHPILTFSEAPEVEVHQIDRPGQPFLGTGEASQGPTGAAIANAVFDAVGARVRELPLSPEHVKAAL